MVETTARELGSVEMMKQPTTLATVFLTLFTLSNAFSRVPSDAAKLSVGVKHPISTIGASKSAHSPLFRQQLQPLHMSDTPSTGEENSNKSDGGLDNSNGFLVALMMGPPLIAKFLILMLVKFVTDLVVFPLLYLYRVVKRLKVAMFSGFKDESSSSSSKLTQEEDMETTIVSFNDLLFTTNFGGRRGELILSSRYVSNVNAFIFSKSQKNRDNVK